MALVIPGDKGTPLWCQRETVKQLTRIANYLEVLAYAENSISSLARPDSDDEA